MGQGKGFVLALVFLAPVARNGQGRFFFLVFGQQHGKKHRKENERGDDGQRNPDANMEVEITEQHLGPDEDQNER